MAFDTLVLAPFSQEGLAALERLGRVAYEPWTQTQTLHDPEELGRRTASEGYHGLVVEADFLFEELFVAAPSLRFAGVCRAALNHVDLDAATKHGVAVVHTPGRNAQAVAELVLTLMLDLARGVPQAVAHVQEGNWQDPTEPYVRFQGRELSGAVLGVIGLGEIGRRVAKLGRGVGMRVLAHDPYARPGRGTAGISLVDLDELLQGSDFVTVQVPETAKTAGLLDAHRMARMRPGSYLINATSPAVLDHRALARAIETGRLAGAALDVHDSHPLAPDAPLLALAKAGHNVLLTPHIGGATRETVDRHSRMVVVDVQRFLAGRRPKHLANPAVWGKRRGVRRSAAHAGPASR